MTISPLAAVADNEWLRFAAERQWIALSHDDNIRRDREALRTVMESSGRLFIIRGALTSPELAAVFLQAFTSVKKLLARRHATGGFIATIRRVARAGGQAQVEARLWLTLEEWKDR